MCVCVCVCVCVYIYIYIIVKGADGPQIDRGASGEGWKEEGTVSVSVSAAQLYY